MRERLRNLRFLRSNLYEIRTTDLDVLSRGRLLQLLLTGLIVPLTILTVARSLLALTLPGDAIAFPFSFPLGTILIMQAIAMATAVASFAWLRAGKLQPALHVSLSVLDLAIIWLSLRLPGAILSLATLTLLPILVSAVLGSLRQSLPYVAVTLVAIPILLAISGQAVVSYAVISLVMVMAIVAFSNTLNEASQESRELTRDILALADTLQETIHEQTTALRRRAEQLEHSAEVGRVASLSLELPELIKQTTAKIRERFDYSDVSVMLLPSGGDEALRRASLDTRRHEERDIELEEGTLVGWVARNAEARLTEGEPGRRSKGPEIALPLLSRGQVIGVLHASARRKEAIVREDTVVLQLMADQIAANLENARLYAESQRRADLLGQLPQIATTMARQSTVMNVLSAFAQRVRPLLEADGVSVWLHRPGVPGLSLVLCHVGEEERPVATAGVTSIGLPAQLALENRILVVEELHRWPDPLEAATVLVPGVEASSYLVLPIREENQPAGIAAFARRSQRHRFSGEEVQFCEALALQLGVILHNNQLLAEASRLARREQQINQITSELRGSLDVVTALEKAAASLGEALGDARIQIRLHDTVERQPAGAPTVDDLAS